jgi:hypothetical protein
MRRLKLKFAGVLLGLALIVGAGPAVAEDWTDVLAYDGSFTVEMPAHPVYSTKPDETNSDRKYAEHTYAADAGGRGFVVQAVTFPSDIDLSDHKAKLQRIVDGTADDLEGGKWADVRWTTYQGEPAADATGVQAEWPPLEIRMFVVIKNRTLFTLTFSGLRGMAQSADANRFINSFVARR